ncbi:hypothetical protein AsAng_0042400 [Aureispira anguillae]|uniref:Uncharacterized protein n=1 Tax=Aureispira anguillae TaxID=2864201 RepID=A0A915YHW9_9BACT|nr:hypothetical protein AsAng_0042400 [Aureispira anguillae]
MKKLSNNKGHLKQLRCLFFAPVGVFFRKLSNRELINLLDCSLSYYEVV